MNGVDLIVSIIDAAAPPSTPVAAALSAASSAPSQTGGTRAKNGSGKKSGAAAGGKSGGGEPPETTQALNLRLAFKPLTDLGNAERFVERYRDRVMFCELLPGTAKSGGWLVWDGRRWAIHGAELLVRRLEHECVRAIQDEAEACTKEADRLWQAHGDIVERKPKRKAKATGRRIDGRAADNVIAYDFKARKKPKKIEKAEAQAEEKAEAASVEPAKPDKRNAGEIAARIITLYQHSGRLRTWGRQSESNPKMAAVARHAAAYLSTGIDALDSDKFVFNCLNGTLVFRRSWDSREDPRVDGCHAWRTIGNFVKFKPHDPRDHITKLGPVAFIEHALCPTFDTFLARVQPEPAMRAFLQQWKGYQLTGDTTEHRICIFIGGGRNGKGTFEETAAYIIGDYSGSTPIATFLEEERSRAAGQPTPHLAKLPGIRSLRSAEPKPGAVINESLIKSIAGGDPIDARHLNRPEFTFFPDFKWTVSTNHELVIKGTDDGIWSRITKVPWAVTIPEAERDQQLVGKLKAEAPGILNWMIAGLTTWFEAGLVLPETVKTATQEYREDSDQLGRWLKACTVPEKGARMQSSTALACFNAFGIVNGGSGKFGSKTFAAMMKARNYVKTQSDVMVWHDIRLTRFADEFVDDHGKPRTGLGEGLKPSVGAPAARIDDDDVPIL
jgi:P4 family phage/plasmid primase-like protien